eukprot:CCRYP_013509-RA/>CCRYP_013509-RA protein AED:0.45 eAED:0.53 QI:0/0/0/1/0/0/2/0/158
MLVSLHHARRECNRHLCIPRGNEFVREIAEAQKLDVSLKTLKDQYSPQLVESTQVLCKDEKMVIPKDLKHRAVSWYYHCLQHPGHTRLEETLRAAMYWKGMQTTIAVNMSETVMHAKSTRGISISTGNSLLNFPSQTLETYYVLTLLARIQSKVKMGQ